MRYLIILSLFICSTAYAEYKPIADAIEWKYPDAEFTTEGTREKGYKITHWKLNGVKKPTPTNIETIVGQYKDAKTQEKNTKRQVITKLGLTQDEFNNLKDLILAEN